MRNRNLRLGIFYREALPQNIIIQIPNPFNEEGTRYIYFFTYYFLKYLVCANITTFLFSYAYISSFLTLIVYCQVFKQQYQISKFGGVHFNISEFQCIQNVFKFCYRKTNSQKFCYANPCDYTLRVNHTIYTNLIDNCLNEWVVISPWK